MILNPSGNVMDFQYDFHPGTNNGNLYTAQNKRDPSRTQTYTYDTLNRIASLNQFVDVKVTWSAVTD